MYVHRGQRSHVSRRDPRCDATATGTNDQGWEATGMRMRRLARGAGSCWIVLVEISLSDHVGQTPSDRASPAFRGTSSASASASACGQPSRTPGVSACVLGWPLSRPTESLSIPSRRIFLSAPSKDPIACWDAIFPTPASWTKLSTAAWLQLSCVRVRMCHGSRPMGAFVCNRHRERPRAKTGKPAQAGPAPAEELDMDPLVLVRFVERRRKRHHSISYNNLHIYIYMYSSICSPQHGSMHGLPGTRLMLMPWLVPSPLEPPRPWWPSPSPPCVQQRYQRRGPPNAP